MKLKYFAIAAAFCAAAVGCGRKSPAESGAVTVDFHDYEERPMAELGDAFYSSKRYVALHSDDPNLLTGEVGKVLVSGDRIFVANRAYGPRSDNRLIVHDADGRALARIGHQGRGPGEYIQITDFDVDADGCVHLYDGTYGVKKILIYSADGRFEGERQVPFSADLVKCTADGGYIFTISSWDESEYVGGKRFARTDGDMTVGNVSGEWDMEQTDTNMIIASGTLAQTPEGLFYQQSPDENIYRVDEDGNSRAAWFLDFGRYSIPPDVRADLEPMMMSKDRSPYRWIDEFLAPWGRYLFGVMRKQDSLTTQIFVYDMKAGVNYTLTQEYGDLGQPVAISDGYLVTTFGYDGETFPSDMPEELRAGVADGDPLLCLFKLK